MLKRSFQTAITCGWRRRVTRVGARFFSTAPKPAASGPSASPPAVADIEAFYSYSAPPESVHSISTEVLEDEDLGDAGVCIRELCEIRRICLLKPHLTLDEIEGLAYRVKVLTRQPYLSCILIATDDHETPSALPSQMRYYEDKYYHDDFYDLPDNRKFNVSNGYDALEDVYKRGVHEDKAARERLMNSVSSLAKAIRGDEARTKIPVVCLPHGSLNDAGYAFGMGGYVLATSSTSFSILNPSRGLTLDPVGLSYVLPRLGWEYRQVSKDYPGCGLLLALTGMEADASDMVETGLATHMLDSPKVLPGLERELMDLESWDQQALLQEPIRAHMQQMAPHEAAGMYDRNKPFRNLKLSRLLQNYCAYHANGEDIFTPSEEFFQEFNDPSTDLDQTPFVQTRSSTLLNYAATFHEIFLQERSVVGILERFRQIAEADVPEKEDNSANIVAKDLVARMEKLSPLALRVSDTLLRIGAKGGETVESCMVREYNAQLNMMKAQDFEAWGHHASSARDGTPPWKYKSLKEVPEDEVLEIIER